MNLDAINAAAATYRNDRAFEEAKEKYYAEKAAEEAAAAEAEANKPITEKITDFFGSINYGENIRSAMGETYSNGTSYMPAYTQEMPKIEEMGDLLSSAADNLAEIRKKGAQLQAAGWESMKTGDNTALSAAVEDIQAEGGEFINNLGRAVTLPGKYGTQDIVKHYADDQTSPVLRPLAQYLQQTDTNLQYYMTDADQMNLARDIQTELGIPAEAIIGDKDAYKKALEVYHFKKKVENIEDVWDMYPELKDVANMSTQSAAVALHEMNAVKQTHGIIDSFLHGFGKGSDKLEYDEIQYKIMRGEATDEEKKRAEDLKSKMEKEHTQYASFLDAMAGGAAESLPEMVESIKTGGASAAAMAALSVAFTVATGGTGAAAIAGGAALRTAILRALGGTAAKRAFQAGMFWGMAKPEMGARFAELGELKNVDGTPLLSEDERRLYAAVGGATNAGIEMANLGLITNALKPYPHATKVFGDIVKNAAIRKSQQEKLMQYAGGWAKNTLTIAASESGEEAVQSAADDAIHNYIVADKGAYHIKSYSLGEIAERSYQSAVEAFPAALGFGVTGATIGAAGRAGTAYRSSRRDADIAREYGENARQTMAGTVMVEQLQQAVASGKLKEKAPDVQKKILRSQLSGTGYEMAYIDVETALKNEKGMDDLQKIAKETGMTDSELQTAIEENGIITVPTEILSQVSTTPDLLDSVSFKPEAESMARMRETQKELVKQYDKAIEKMAKRREKILETIVKENLPNATDEQKRIIREAITSNPDNPAQGWNTLRKGVQEKLDEILAPALKALNEGMGKAGLLEVEDENGNKKTTRYTENAEWYRNFYKTFHRRPTKAELEDMAIAMITGDPSAPKVENWIPDNAEMELAMQENKGTIEAIKNDLAAIDSVKDGMKDMTGTEMNLTSVFEPETYKAYKKIMAFNKSVGGSTARQARAGAILSATHAQIIAKRIEKLTGKKYTAEDYVNDKLGFTIRPLQKGMNQFAGETAENASIDKLVQAKNLEKQGTSMEDIYKETGWVKGRDGKWRFEIPDNLDKVDWSIFEKGNPDVDHRRLKNLYDNPRLYEAYPWLENTAVHLMDLEKDVHGGVRKDFSGTNIVINKQIGDAERSGALIHEIQHLIQEEEGFASGGNEKTAYNQIIARIRDLSNQIKTYPHGEHYAQALMDQNEMLFSEEENEQAEKAVNNEISELEKEISLDDREKIWELAVEKSYLQSELQNNDRNDYELYRNLAGEQEARHATDRAIIHTNVVRAEKELAEKKAKYEAEKAKQSPAMKKMLDELEVLREKDEKTDAEFDRIDEIRAAMDEKLMQAETFYAWAKDTLEMRRREAAETPQPHDENAIAVFGGQEMAMSQEPRTLAAYHNTRVDNLEKLLEQGLAVPSIAITHKDISYDNFGDVTLVGNRNLINPESGVPVWTRDAYTTRIPRAEYLPTEKKKIKAFMDKWRKNLQGIGEGEYVLDRLEEAAQEDPERVEARTHRDEFTYYYLTKVLGRDVELKHIRPDYEVPILRNGIYAEQIESIMHSKKKKADKKKALTEVFVARYEKALAEYAESIPKKKAYLDAQPSPKRKMMYEKALERQRETQDNLAAIKQTGEISEEQYKEIQKDISRVDKAEKESTEINWSKTFSEMRANNKDALNSDKYQRWQDKLLEDIRGNAVIKIGRKYEPYTTDNIVRAMLTEKGAGQEGGLGFSTSKAAAIGATPLKSIADLHKNESRLVTREQANSVIADVDTAIDESFEGVREYHKNIAADSYSLPEIFNEAVANAIKGGKKATAANMKTALKKMDFDVAKIPASAINKAVDAANKMREAAAWYFEAKPQRAVGINEFSGAVVPEDTPAETIQKLINNGLTVETYNPEVAGDRQRATKAVQEKRAETIFQRAWHGRQYDFETKGQTANVNGKRIVSIMEHAADESTFMHEMAHVFLYDLQELAAIDEDSRLELDVVAEWGQWHKGDAQKLYSNTPWTREFAKREQEIIDAEEHHDYDLAEQKKREWVQERFARAFELYLRDGQAPSSRLKAVFRQFKEFLSQLYSAFINDGARASEPVKRVMDRMIATADEIQAAELEDRYSDFEAAGGKKLFDETDAEVYKRWYKECEEDAKEKLLKIVMKDLDQARQEEFDTKVAIEEQRKRAELRQENVYVAEQAVLASGDENIVTEWYPSIEAFQEELAITPPLEDVLRDHMQKYRDDLDAELMNSHLSPETVDKVMDTAKYRNKLEALKSKAMAKKAGLINRINAKAARAMDSLEDKLNALPDDMDLMMDAHEPQIKSIMKEVNKLRFASKWTKDELGHIESMIRAGTQAEIKQALKEFKEKARQDKAQEDAVMKANEGRRHLFRELAKQAATNKPIADSCNVNYYKSEARKAARRVQDMLRAGRWDMALVAQEQLGFQTAMVEIAEKNKEKMEKLVDQVKRELNAKTVRLPKDERYWHRHLAFLLRITQTDAAKPESGVKELDDLFGEMKEALDIQDVPLKILDVATRGEDFQGYPSLTLDEFKEAVDAIHILYKVGKDKFKLKTIAGKTIGEVVEEIRSESSMASASMVDAKKINDDKGGLAYSETIGNTGSIGHLLAKQGQQYILSNLKPENLINMLGEKAHKYLYGTLERAAEEEAKLQEQNIKALREIMSVYSHQERQDFTKKMYEFSTEGTDKISKENIMAMALNWGTLSNRQRLLGGLAKNNTPEAVNQMMNEVMDLFEETMTEKDWLTVQRLWDHVNSYWDMTVKVEEELNGTALVKIPPMAFTMRTADGKTVELAGGYMEVKYNPEKSSKAAEQDINKAAQSGLAGNQRLGAGRAFTKGRSEFDIFRALKLNFDVIENHLQDVIHNATYRIPVRDVYRILTNLDFENYVVEHLGRDAHNILKDWALDAWKQNINGSNTADNVISRSIAWLRSNSTMAIMGMRVWPAIENVSNLSIAVDKIGAGKMAAALGQFYASPAECMAKVKDMSIFMRNRLENMDRDIRSQTGIFRARNKLAEFASAHAYDLMVYSDLMVSAPLWLKSYKDSYAPSLEKVKRENEANIAYVMQAQQELDAVIAQINDIKNETAQMEEHLRARRYASPETAEMLRQSPFAVHTDDNLRALSGENKKRLKELEKELWKAEVKFQEAQEIKILSDDEIIAETERRAVFAADGVIRDTFGSGRMLDQASVQRSTNELTKLLTTFYSFFNTQFNALFMAYQEGHTLPNANVIQRWMPFAKSFTYRVVGAALIGSTVQFAMGLAGNDDDDKKRKEKNAEGKEIEVEIPAYERFLKVFAKNTLSIASGSMYFVRDIIGLATDFVLSGKTYGLSTGSVATRSLSEFGKMFALMAKKGEKDAQIQEQQEKREAKHQEKLQKLKGKKRQEYLKKWEEEQKYIKPPKRITYAEIAGHGLKGVSGFTANYTGVTSTMVNAVTSTMQYLLDTDMRYDPTMKNIIWSAIFDKRPVERDIPQKPPKEKTTKNKKKSNQSER